MIRNDDINHMMRMRRMCWTSTLKVMAFKDESFDLNTVIGDNGDNVKA